MVAAINLGQPALALPQSVVTQGEFPIFNQDPRSNGTAASLGLLI